MNWIRNFVKPKLKQWVGREMPDDLWQKCNACEKMIFHRELKENWFVCPHCDHHMRISAKDRLGMLLGTDGYTLVTTPRVLKDPLKFKDLKKYTERHKCAQTKSGLSDAMLVAQGSFGAVKTVLAVMDFNFMGGSMGLAVGESFVTAIEHAIELRAPLAVIASSGGARMQEGILSLMQMARTTAAIQKLRDADIPYIVVMTDPTSGGVTASFAMLGDIHLAEPGAMICFAGRRVIEQTIKEQLPDDFQTAEYLRDHGMIDRVVHRHQLREELSNLLAMATYRA